MMEEIEQRLDRQEELIEVLERRLLALEERADREMMVAHLASASSYLLGFLEGAYEFQKNSDHRPIPVPAWTNAAKRLSDTLAKLGGQQ